MHWEKQSDDLIYTSPCCKLFGDNHIENGLLTADKVEALEVEALSIHKHNVDATPQALPLKALRSISLDVHIVHCKVMK